MQKFEFKKQKEYIVKDSPQIIIPPKYNRIAISGAGSPGGDDFSNKVPTLFQIAYYIKMKMKDAKDYQDFVVGPLEGVYTTSDNKDFDGNKDKLVWTIFLNMPSFVTKDMFEEAQSEVSKDPKKHIENLKSVVFEEWNEGMSIQILHIGPYETEKESLDKLKEFAKLKALVMMPESHHEIYLSDFRKVAKENLRTILRYKVYDRC